MDNSIRSILITGVSGGMGAAAARRFLDEGFQVFGLDIRKPEDNSFTFIPADLTDMDSVEAAFKKVSSMTDHLDCIINMAGMYDLNSLAEISEEDFRKIFDVNLFSVYRVNKVFLPLLDEGSRIIITSSELAPLDPLPFTGLYAVTKSAVEKYAFSLRMELQLLGIRVILLRPGAVDTRFIGISTKKLDAFCENTTLYSCNSVRFKNIVDRVEARKIPPERIAAAASKAFHATHPRYVYKINRNPLLLLLNILPARWQTGIIGRILR